jgi:Acetyltransferase (GNAT) domain
VEQRITNTLFEESYWLDAAAPGEWHAAEVHGDGLLIGRLPYVQKKLLAQTVLTKPWYTPWLGPWISPTGGKYLNEIGHQHQVLEQLIQMLPRATRGDIFCAPEHTNMMAFQWAGHQLSMAYTHRLHTADLDAVWNGLRTSVRTQIRNSEKKLEIHQHRKVTDMISIIEKTFGRQSIDVSKSFPALERIDAMMEKRGQRKILTAEDAQGRICAAIYLVFDDRHVFYLAGGSDPELRQGGAQSLAMWHAIKAAQSIAPLFDFAGSMVPAIEFFVRNFGAQQVPRYAARRYQGLGKLLAVADAVRA